MKKIVRHILKNKEAVIWTAALLMLALLDPASTHVSICPLKLTGLDFCPGCGLGHSIGYAFRGQFESSFETHPLGVFAIIILSYRIIYLIYNNYKLQKQ